MRLSLIYRECVHSLNHVCPVVKYLGEGEKNITGSCESALSRLLVCQSRSAQRGSATQQMRNRDEVRVAAFCAASVPRFEMHFPAKKTKETHIVLTEDSTF